MPSGSQKLSEDFEQVKKLLKSYPNIKILKTVGDPPEQYDIEYSIKGYKTNPDGTAIPENKHEVRINLPFGYPHFPPTAKPITPIFHPDIDPDAIRIADFWQKNHSLAELIVHIGQMICGNHYTKEEPFNQSAFEWFEERKSWLPFDILEPGDEAETPSEETKSEPAEPARAETGKKGTLLEDLDNLEDVLDFPFDDKEGIGEDEFSFDVGDEEGTGEPGDEFSFDTIEEELAEPLSGTKPTGKTEEEISNLGDDTITEELPDLEEGEPTDEISFEPLEEEQAEPLSDKKDAASEEQDIFELETAEESDTFSLDLDELQQEGETLEPEGGEIDLSELETEAPAGKSDEGEALAFDSDNIEAAFIEDETTATPEQTEEIVISPDDLSGLEQEEEPLDFGIEEESFDLDDASTADLSGLEEELIGETVEEPETVAETGAGDEEKILSALSLDQDFSSPDKAEEQSTAIRAMIEQKQIFSAKKILADLPDPEALTDKEELELTIANAVSEAEDLYKKADKHEKKGEFEKAGILLDLVANIATDFPGLEMARNRIRESILESGKNKPASEGEEKKPDKFIGEEEAPAKPAKKKKAPTKFRIRISARLVAGLVIVVVLCGIGAGFAFVYKNDDKNVQLAQKAVQKAEQLVDRKEFKAAQQEFNGANAALKKVLIFQGEKKEALTRNIAAVVDSSLFKEGMQGRVLYGDKYVNVKMAKTIDKFNTQKGYADQVLKSGKTEQAIAAYEKAVTYAETAGLEEEAVALGQRVAQMRLELALSQAKEFEKKQEWGNAQNAYQKAVELSKSTSPPGEQKDIALRHATASYRYAHGEGLKAINDSQWQKSIEFFQQVKKVLKENPTLVPEEEQIEDNKLLVKSQLYFELSEAKRKFGNKKWEDAVATYNKAISFLKKNSGLLGQEETADDIKKIEKTILTTWIAKEQDGIVEANAAKDMEKAVSHYQKIVTLLKESPFKNEETLAKILEDAETKSTEIKNQLLISKRKTWLKQNYEKIFRDNYPSAKLSDLVNPQVRFVKRDGNRLIFNMSCTEIKQGRAFTLELYYQNDLSKDAWSLFSGKIEEEEPGSKQAR